jgi:hypothetical protein
LASKIRKKFQNPLFPVSATCIGGFDFKIDGIV